MIAADDLAVIDIVDGETTHLLADLSEDDESFYLGASNEGDTCLIIVSTSVSAGCGGGAAGLLVSDRHHSLELVTEGDDDAVPSAALTQSVPEGCLAVRHR